jgi:serine protease Do
MPQPRVEGQGSGVIIRSDGYIVTNDHVVSGATDVEVTFYDGTKAKGEVLRAPSADIAVIKVNRTNLPAAVLGDSSAVKPGQIAFAIGSPFGLENTLTMGIISAVGRRETIPGRGRIRFYPDLIQTDAPPSTQATLADRWSTRAVRSSASTPPSSRTGSQAAMSASALPFPSTA